VGNDVARLHTALIVDDNSFNREIFQLALEAAGYETTQARNGTEALVVLEARRFDLAVLDLQMPFVNGVVVLQRVRSNPVHARMKVIVATANPHMAIQDVQNLADYVMYKPIDIHEFASLAGRLKKTTDEATLDR
jgi:CheY-like chemotaxis protein